MNDILKSYFPMADIIAGTFGSTCEVVVHDLTQPESSVIYVANGNVTGRKVGQSFDHLVKFVLLNKNFKNDSVINYEFNTQDGRKIKSSSALIRDLDNEVIGMLCINYDVTVLEAFHNQINNLLTPPYLEEKEEEEVILDQNIMIIIDELIFKIISNSDLDNLTRKKSLEMVKFMDEKGIFLVKGAIDKVAAALNVSRVTIYSYLDEVRGKRC